MSNIHLVHSLDQISWTNLMTFLWIVFFINAIIKQPSESIFNKVLIWHFLEISTFVIGKQTVQ